MNKTLELLGQVLVQLASAIGPFVWRRFKSNREPGERSHIVDLFFISLFLTMNFSLLTGILTKADHFGFYTFEPLRSTAMQFLAAIMAHFALSLVAAVMFSKLWTPPHGSRDRDGAFSRAVGITHLPILSAFAIIVIFTNLGTWISFMVIFGILFGAFTTIVALNEPGVTLRDVAFVLKVAIAVIALLCSFGVAGALVAYLEPDMMVTASEFRIISLKEISAEELGYTPEQGMEFLRLGSLWFSLANILYLAIVVGGYLLVTINRARSSQDAVAS